MTDWLKGVLSPADIQGALNSPYLNFERKVSETTGELRNYKVAEDRGQKVIIFDSGYGEYQGSLHYLFNNGHHNANDFTIIDLMNAIRIVKNDYGIDLLNIRILNIEFGVNNSLPFKVIPLLNNLLMHRTEKFKEKSVKGGNFRQVLHSHFIIKCYFKGLQFKGYCQANSIENLFRFELKFKKMKELNELGFFTLADLNNRKVVERIGSLLIKRWNECLLFDISLEREALKALYKPEKYYQWSNVNYWLELRRQRRKEQRIIYESFVENYSGKRQQIVANLIIGKWQQLTKQPLQIYRIIDAHFVTILPLVYKAS